MSRNIKGKRYQLDIPLFSDHLKEPLQEFVDGKEKVTLVRAKERTGLIRARLLGFDACRADVAVFLDSHCEATTGRYDKSLCNLFQAIGNQYRDSKLSFDETTSSDSLWFSYRLCQKVH